MITREQIADLQPGDVVEYGNASYGWTITGALWESPGGALMVGNCVVRHSDGNPPVLLSRTLTVVSRAPRPLYVNHPRTEPVKGDIVRDSDGDAWQYADGWHGCFCGTSSTDNLRARWRLTLLVDGETGMTVPS